MHSMGTAGRIETRWFEDAPSSPPEPRPLCVDAKQQRAFSRVNFPLFVYSVFGEKNVSQEKEDNSERLQRP
jgi:hypothetical protein